MLNAPKASGFLGLTTMKVVDLYQFILFSGGNSIPNWIFGGHAHLGVLSILAMVVAEEGAQPATPAND